jgi:hypothetical protein
MATRIDKLFFSVRTIMEEDDHLVHEIRYFSLRIQLLFLPEVDGEVLKLKGLHIEGTGKGHAKNKISVIKTLYGEHMGNLYCGQ